MLSKFKILLGIDPTIAARRDGYLKGFYVGESAGYTRGFVAGQKSLRDARGRFRRLRLANEQKSKTEQITLELSPNTVREHHSLDRLRETTGK